MHNFRALSDFRGQTLGLTSGNAHSQRDIADEINESSLKNKWDFQ